MMRSNTKRQASARDAGRPRFAEAGSPAAGAITDAPRQNSNLAPNLAILGARIVVTRPKYDVPAALAASSAA